jgi:hypothetical protein
MRSRSILVFLTVALGCSSSSAPANLAPAIITFAFDGHPADTMRVFVNRQQTIADAETYVATHHGPKLLAGVIVRGAGVDPRYPFQFLPETVELIDAAIASCDAAPMRTDAAVNDFFFASIGNRSAPTATWCPWSSYPIQVQRLLPD